MKLTHALRDIALEALWPTRCAVCDTPGSLLCEKCAKRLIFIDPCFACPTCGAPYGIYECTECNDHTKNSCDFDFDCIDSAAYVAIANDVVQRIVATYKDRDEKRLAHLIAAYMANFIEPTMLPANPVQHNSSNPASTRASLDNLSCEPVLPLITFIPDSKAALTRRGFDHMELIAHELSCLTSLQIAKVFERPQSTDQRKLNRAGRAKNIRGAFHVLKEAPISQDILIIDDISTTGATIYGAAKALQNARASIGVNAKTHILTFGKVLD